MPLCIILTKCPEPPSPIHSHSGDPLEDFAAIAQNISRKKGLSTKMNN